MSQVNPVKPVTPATTKKSIGLPLLTWEDPVKTGKIFGATVVALIVLKSVNLLSLFFRLGAYSLIASAAAEYSGKLITGTGFITRVRPAYSTVFSSGASKYLQALASDLPSLETEVQKLLYSFNVENTLKAAGLFYILFKITSWVSLYSLIFTSVVLAFTVPAVYEKYQDEINAAVSQYSKVAVAKAGEFSKVAQEKAAPYIKQADSKLGPVSKFIKQKYQIRTASTTVGESAPASTFAQPSSAKTSSAPASTPASSGAASIPVPVQTSTATTSGANIRPEATGVPTSQFPKVPETTPLATQVKQTVADSNVNVDVEDLKNDLLKNKAAAANTF